MKMEYIEEYLVLADTLNFSLAARQLFISQPTLSRHVQLMEEELGCALVETSSHGVRLTEFGEQALRHFKKIVKEYRNVLEQGADLSQQISGTLTIGLLYYAINDYFADFLSYFKEKYKKVNLICRSYIPQPLWDDLYAGKVDIATLFYDKNNRPKEMQMYDIDYISMIAMLREDNPLCEKEEITFKELSEYPLIQLKDDPYSRQITEQNIKASGVEFKNMIQADNIEMVPMVVRKTGGVHITGESCRKQNASEIKYRRIKEDKMSSILGFCSMVDNTDPLVKLFFDELKRSK